MSGVFERSLDVRRRVSVSAYLVCLCLTASAAQAQLSLTIVPSQDPVRAGHLLIFRLVAANHGSVDYQAVTLEASLPAFTSAVAMSDNGVCQGGISCDPGDPLRWTIGELRAGRTRDVELHVQVAAGSGAPPAGTLIRLSAEVTDIGGAAASGSAEVTVVSSSLTLAMVADREPVSVGDIVTYTVTLGNRGPLDATSGALDVEFPVALEFVGADEGGALDGGVIRWSLEGLALGRSLQRTWQARVAADTLEATVLVAHAHVSESTTGSEARSTTATVVRNNYPLGLRSTIAPDPVAPGDIVVYRLTVTNQSTSLISAFSVETFLPSGTSLIGADYGGSCLGGISCDVGDRIQWTLGNLPPMGERTVEARFRVSSTSPPPNGFLIFLRARLSGSPLVADTALMVDSASTVAVTIEHLSLPVIQATEEFIVTFSNHGVLDAPDAVLTATVPPGATITEAAPDGVVDGEIVRWPLGRVNSGKGYVRTFSVSHPPDATNRDILTTSVTIADTAGQRLARATGLAVIHTEEPAIDLAVAAPDVVRPGDLVVYQLTLRNRGSTPLDVIRVQTFLPQHATLQALSSSGQCFGNFSCDPGNTIQWGPGPFEAGGVRTLELRVDVDSGSHAPRDGTLIFARVTALASNLAEAVSETTLRVCAAGGNRCDVLPLPPPTVTFTPSSTPTITRTQTPSPLPTETSTVTPTSEASLTPTTTATPSPTASRTSSHTATPDPTVPPPECTGNCNNDNVVTIYELIDAVDTALDRLSADECLPRDGNRDHAVTVDEIVAGVNNAIAGCPL